MTNKNFALVAGKTKNVRTGGDDRVFLAFTVEVGNGGNGKSFIPVILNGLAAERLRDRLADGQMVVVEGRFEPRNDRYQVSARSVDIYDGGEMNLAVLQGRLTRDPEVRTTSNGTPVASGTLAVDRSYKKGDDWETITSFVNINAWENLADDLAGFQKGDQIYIVGSLRSRKYTTKDGQDKYPVEVTAENIVPGGTGKRNAVAEATAKAEAPVAAAFEEEEDEDLPF